MNETDLYLYVVHGAYWMLFGIARSIARTRASSNPTAPLPEDHAAAVTSGSAWSVIALHALAFGLMYFAIGASVFTGTVAAWFGGQRVIGGLVIGLGAALSSWSVLHFASWRLLAKLDTNHQLATTGPFALMRHPIYMSFNLLALGSAIWSPNVLSWAAVVAMAVFGDVRARSEEPLLHEKFGAVYDSYCRRTARFLPRLY